MSFLLWAVTCTVQQVFNPNLLSGTGPIDLPDLCSGVAFTGSCLLVATLRAEEQSLCSATHTYHRAFRGCRLSLRVCVGIFASLHTY